MEQFVELLVNYRYAIRSTFQKERLNDYISNVLSDFDEHGKILA